MAMKFNPNTNNAISSITNAAPSASVDAIGKIKLDLIDEFEDNEAVFGYGDGQETENIAQEIQQNGFRGAIEVVPSKTVPGHYTCLSGHQRIRALRLLKETEVPCQILRGLSDSEARAYWRSANVLHRKLTAWNYAKLVEDLDKEYAQKKKAGEAPVGGRSEYAAVNLRIGLTQVKRFRSILSMPEDIQKWCNKADFPYATLIESKDFTEEEYDKLRTAVDGCNKKSPGIAITAAKLKKIINQIKSDRAKPEYADTDPLESYETHTGEGGREAKAFEKKQKEKIESHYSEIEEKNSDRKPQIIDEKLVAGVDSLFDLVSGPYTVGNRMLANQAIIGLKKVLKKLESQEY